LKITHFPRTGFEIMYACYKHMQKVP